MNLNMQELEPPALGLSLIKEDRFELQQRLRLTTYWNEISYEILKINFNIKKMNTASTILQSYLGVALVSTKHGRPLCHLDRTLPLPQFFVPPSATQKAYSSTLGKLSMCLLYVSIWKLKNTLDENTKTTFLMNQKR
ncbi:unnamed protein product [Amoebophrya sp. A120]|nr:unnamed protein product [Amoebophrya sp. A120]|eukprot:GSA120T00001661001.1